MTKEQEAILELKWRLMAIQSWEEFLALRLELMKQASEQIRKEVLR